MMRTSCSRRRHCTSAWAVWSVGPPGSARGLACVPLCRRRRHLAAGRTGLRLGKARADVRIGRIDSQRALEGALRFGRAAQRQQGATLPEVALGPARVGKAESLTQLGARLRPAQVRSFHSLLTEPSFGSTQSPLPAKHLEQPMDGEANAGRPAGGCPVVPFFGSQRHTERARHGSLPVWHGKSFACLSRDRVAPVGRSSGSSCSRLQTATAQQPSHV